MGAPEIIVVEIEPIERGDHAERLDWLPRTYRARALPGAWGPAVTLPWDELRADVEALISTEAPTPVRESIGERLRVFLDQALAESGGWGVVGRRLVEAEGGQRSAHLVLRLGSNDLLILPWDVVRVDAARSLGMLTRTIPQYECQEDQAPRSRALGESRVLFAWSSAGGGVPEGRHRLALQTAYPGFDPSRDELEDVTLESLEEHLSRASAEGHPYRLLHILCHGAQTRAGTFGLKWSEPRNDHGLAVIDGEVLARALGPHARSLKTVVLAACYGGNSSQTLFGGVGHILHKLGIPNVVASRVALSIEGSVEFSRAFHGGLGKQRLTVAQAFQGGRNALSTFSRDWLALQLFTIRERTDDGLHLRGERRIFSDADSLPDLSRQPLVVLAEINATVSEQAVLTALADNSSPAQDFVVLQPLGKTGDMLPSTRAQWQRAFSQIDRLATALNRKRADRDVNEGAHLFGCAPLPLMFYLGWALGRKSLKVYQQTRARSDEWYLKCDSEQPCDRRRTFFLRPPPIEVSGSRIALTVEVSGRIHDQVLANWLVQESAAPEAIRLIASPAPSHDAITSLADVARAANEFQDCLDRVHQEYPNVTEVLLAMQCPASLAAAFGRTYNRKTQPALRLYNFRTSEGYRAVGGIGV